MSGIDTQAGYATALRGFERQQGVVLGGIQREAKREQALGDLVAAGVSAGGGTVTASRGQNLNIVV